MTAISILHAAEPLPPGDRGWAYAVGAVYHAAHGFAIDGVDPLQPGDFQQAMLLRDWGIQGADDLIEQLNQLGAEGHRYSNAAKLRYYALQWRPSIARIREELRALIREEGEDAGDARADLWRLDAVQANLPGIRRSPLLAFDAARAVMLARSGLMLRWLGEVEAWNYMIDIACDVQRTYDSWAAYADDFVLSRNVWRGGSELDGFDTSVEMLKNDPLSPWVRLPWAMPSLIVPRPLRAATGNQPAWTLEQR